MGRNDNGFGFRKGLSIDALRMAFRTQSLLLETYVSMVKYPYDPGVTRVILRESAEIFRRLVCAELCSLIIFTSDGKVAESFYLAADGPRI